MNIKNSFFVLLLMGALTLIGNFVGAKNNILEAFPGMLILIAIAFVGIVLSKKVPIKLPAVAYIVTLGCLVTFPGFPGSEYIVSSMSKVNFLALTTPILAYVGLSIGKDIESFKKSGWRIVVVSCVVFTGTYIGSAVIAQLILKSMGQI